MDLSDLRAFLQVVEHGSFQRASVALRVSRGGLRRQVERLERELEVPLLRRGARGIEPTAAGAEVLTGAATLLREAELVTRRARASKDGLRGVMRFIVPSGLPVEPRARALLALRAANPELDVEVAEAEDPLTRLGDAFDLMLHFGDAPEREGWYSHVVWRTPSVLQATPAYLSEHGNPQTTEALGEHALLQWKPPGAKGRGLPLCAGGSLATSPWVQSTNLALLHELAIGGAGILYAPVFPVVFGRSPVPLTTILGDVVSETVTLRALSPRPSRADPRIRALLENMQRLLAALVVSA